MDLNPLLASTATEMETEGNNNDNADNGGDGDSGGKEGVLDQMDSHYGAADEGRSGGNRMGAYTYVPPGA